MEEERLTSSELPIPVRSAAYVHFWKKDSSGTLRRISSKKGTLSEAMNLVARLMNDQTVVGEIELSYDRIYQKTIKFKEVL